LPTRQVSIVANLTKANPRHCRLSALDGSALSGHDALRGHPDPACRSPPIANETTDGWVSGIMRVADALLIVVDLTEDADIQMELILDQLGK